MSMLSDDEFDEGNLLTVINSDQLSIAGSEPRMSLSVPQELTQNLQDIAGPTPRVVAALYHDVKGLLPGNLPGRNK